MKIPDNVKVGPYTYSIERRDRVTDGATVYLGRCLLDKRIILLADGYSEDTELESFFHETLHAIDDAWDLDLKESQIKRLSVGILTVLKDNKLLRE